VPDPTPSTKDPQEWEAEYEQPDEDSTHYQFRPEIDKDSVPESVVKPLLLQNAIVSPKWADELLLINNPWA